MKRVVAVVGVAVCLIATSVAVASFLPKHVANRHSLDYAKDVCHKFRSCRYYGVVQCVRVSGHRVDCKVFQEHKGRSGRKSTCNTWLEWRSQNNRLFVHDEPAHCVSGWLY